MFECWEPAGSSPWPVSRLALVTAFGSEGVHAEQSVGRGFSGNAGRKQDESEQYRDDRGECVRNRVDSQPDDAEVADPAEQEQRRPDDDANGPVGSTDVQFHQFLFPDVAARAPNIGAAVPHHREERSHRNRGEERREETLTERAAPERMHG